MKPIAAVANPCSTSVKRAIPKALEKEPAGDTSRHQRNVQKSERVAEKPTRVTVGAAMGSGSCGLLTTALTNGAVHVQNYVKCRGVLATRPTSTRCSLRA
jgi:hypothetical protein